MKVNSKYEELSKYYIELCDEQIINIKLKISLNYINNKKKEIEMKIRESNNKIKKINNIIKPLIY